MILTVNIASRQKRNEYLTWILEQKITAGWDYSKNKKIMYLTIADEYAIMFRLRFDV